MLKYAEVKRNYTKEILLVSSVYIIFSGLMYVGIQAWKIFAFLWKLIELTVMG